MLSNHSKSIWTLLPVWGILLFIILYIVAASLYPGGSDADPAAIGFSWQHNYWCELMAPLAANGNINTARPVAITAMAILAVSLIILWNIIPFLFRGKNKSNILVRICGSLSMLLLPLLLIAPHDTVINAAGLSGSIAIIIVLVRLYQYRMHGLFLLGAVCLLLCGLNNYVYHTTRFFYYLPVIQKVSFVVFLLWFVLLSRKVQQQVKRS